MAGPDLAGGAGTVVGEVGWHPDVDDGQVRDGNADIVTIGRNDLCLYRWSGNGSGSFAAPVPLGCGWGPYNGSLAGVGDLNGDGNGDLVGINTNNNCLYRWSGNGAGSFAPAVVLGCGWGPYRSFVTGVGDITRDGRADLVAVNGDSGCLYRWSGDGAGSFGPGVLLGCGWEPYLPALVGAGDLNRDGNGDLVAISRTDNCLYRWNGDGAGSFRDATRLGCGWGPYIYSMAN